VMDICGRHGKLGGGKKGGRSRSEEASFADHAYIVAATGCIASFL
jgi:hypothetical protein